MTVAISPIKIKCSNSSIQIVRVKNDQDIHIIVTDGSKVQISTEFLCLINTRVFIDGAVIYEVSQVDTYYLNMNSMFYLGEILIGTKTLLIYLESAIPEKSNFLTVLNPTFDTVLLRPYQMLEIIIPDVIFPITSWQWEWIAFEKIEIDHVANRCIRMTNHHWAEGTLSEAFSIAPKISMAVENLQRHFWFRFNKSIIDALKEDIGRCHPVGRLTFSGKVGPKKEAIHSECVVDIYVDLKRKYLSQTEDVLVKSTYSYNINPLKGRATQVSEVHFQLLNGLLDEGCSFIDWDERYELPIQK